MMRFPRSPGSNLWVTVIFFTQFDVKMMKLSPTYFSIASLLLVFGSIWIGVLDCSPFMKRESTSV